eukprot:5904492-Alexandrium_andersonii.AAC.1
MSYLCAQHDRRCLLSGTDPEAKARGSGGVGTIASKALAVAQGRALTAPTRAAHAGLPRRADLSLIHI